MFPCVTETSFRRRFVSEKARAGRESDGHSAWTLVVADQHDRGHAVETRRTHEPGKLNAVGRGHVKIQEDNVKLSFVEETGSFGASRESQRLHTGGVQDLADQIADYQFVVHN